MATCPPRVVISPMIADSKDDLPEPTDPTTITNSPEINYIDGLVQDCSNSSALAMELLQSCTKPSMYLFLHICSR